MNSKPSQHPGVHLLVDKTAIHSMDENDLDDYLRDGGLNHAPPSRSLAAVGKSSPHVATLSSTLHLLSTLVGKTNGKSKLLDKSDGVLFIKFEFLDSIRRVKLIEKSSWCFNDDALLLDPWPDSKYWKDCTFSAVNL